MVRTQVYLTEDQHAALQHAAANAGISMTEAIRRLIDRHLLARGQDAERSYESVFSFVGMAEGDVADVAERHDEYLAQAFGAPHLR